MNTNVVLLGHPAQVRSPRPLRWLARSRLAAVVWTVGRIWLGIQWIQAGKAKLWGPENSAFLHHNGAGVAGFAAHGAASYTWWHHFLTGFVVPNSGWIGVSISVAEFVIGVALVIGVLTPAFALAGLVLNLTYMFSGTAGVNPMFMLISVPLIVAWSTSGWIGMDGILMGLLQRRRRGQMRHGPASDALRPAPTAPDVDLTAAPPVSAVPSR
jgi:thiosulfate dehydrogenase [quinone] large subunit